MLKRNQTEMKNTYFKKVAKEHQISFRVQNIRQEYNKYETWLSDKDGKEGKNFYDGFSILPAVQKRHPSFYINLYSDMLRSEHIPFNLFVPFRSNLNYCRDVFNEFMNGKIKSIDNRSIYDNKENIKIEFAPLPKKNYLNDRTSFDAYIEFNHQDGSKGILGIEVEYKLLSGSIEERAINDKSSMYYSVSRDSGLYKLNSENELKSDLYRQIWRNQLLVESMRLVNNSKFKHSSSLIFYPVDNEHFKETSESYSTMLLKNKQKFVSVTYEKFISACYKHCPNSEYKTWVDYLSKRYLIK